MATFTFIAEFRDGTYCSQVEAAGVAYSLGAWIVKITEQQKEIKHLGPKVIDELTKEIEESDNKPVALTGLKNAWCVVYSTRKGFFHINIVQTDTA